MHLDEYEKEHLKKVRKLAAECTLFLKKDGSFPCKEAGQLAAFGAGIRGTVMGGTGSGEVNSRFLINIEKGLERAGFVITSKEWLNAYDKMRAEAKVQFIQAVRAEAKANHQNILTYCMGKSMPEPEYNIPLTGEGTTAIYVLSRNSGEGSDRSSCKGDIMLTETEVRDILLLNERYERFMLVLNTGGPVDLTPVSGVKNILSLSQLGAITGDVLADILLGRANPSGKLATTWSSVGDYNNVGEFGGFDETRYREGIYVGYRYFDSVGKRAMYPFGYGIGYSDFAISLSDVILEKDRVSVKVKVTNTGTYTGKETVQVYLSCPEGKLDKAYQDLAGWAKTEELRPGETTTETITFALNDFASYDMEASAYILEKGDYLVRVGSSSVDTEIAAVLKLDADVTVRRTKNCLGTPDFEDWKPEKRDQAELPEDVKVLRVCAEDFITEDVVYDPAYEVDELIRTLTDEELIYLNIGGFDKDAKGLSIIGNASKQVAGAAGESTSVLKEKGIPAMIMSDGPAGLRLAKNYFLDKNGNANAMDTSFIPESMKEYMSKPLLFLANLVVGAGKKPKKQQEIKHQYATALPIGTAIAQSFNTELAYTFGDIVGDEMERFGIHLWLAPALNIHRNILCGRNYEYYSEDPLVSGKMAACITSGVQKHKTCGTTIKHYAANNQETNRYGNNSQVSERALREIYLKGFGICVKEAQPHAVMTSYNLINGTHTSEHRGLIEDVLRCEYGFQGVVMTDWVIAFATAKNAKYRNALAQHVIAAGGDLFMPGGKGDYKNALKGLKEGVFTREQAQINATRTYRLAKRLTELT